jgi:alpha-ketoglutarate-dependent 2,4-dichlorophenoxyacetate dioxygenase
MPITVKPLHPVFVCEITHVDLRNPIDDDTLAAIGRAMDEYAVAVLPGQHITDEQQVEFSRRFGLLEMSPHYGRGAGEKVRMQLPELFDVSNLDEHGNILVEDDRRRAFRMANEMWHTDSSFQPGGAKYSLLSARIVPSNGADTQFADMRAAYDDLAEEKKAPLAELVAEHSTSYSRSLIGFKFSEEENKRGAPAKQWLVQTHPSSARKSLFLASHASHILGWPEQKGRDLLGELTQFATQPKYVYTHKWNPGDLVMWDNRCTMHRATPFSDFAERRDLRRTTVRGDLPIILA